MSNKKYYWLKLKKDFFKRHDIRIIEDMPNGKDYILFYLKLLVESIDHDGALRFSESVPFDEKMLSTITNTNIDIVKSAIAIFTELKMMNFLDNGTIYMSEVNKMLGHETHWAEYKRKERLLDNVQVQSKVSNQEIELEIEKEIKHKYTKDFELLWIKYPNKFGKKESLRHFNASVKTDVDLINLTKAVDNYLRYIDDNKIDPSFVKHGKTFFNNWKDYVELESSSEPKIKFLNEVA